MAVLVLHDTEGGIYRLLNAMHDVVGRPPRHGRDLSFAEAAPELRKLFEGYLKMMRQVHSEAEPWWRNTVAAERTHAQSDEEALAAAFDKRAAGAAAYPRVVWVVRMIWFECCKRNGKQSDDEKVRPEYLMVQWLIDAGETELVRLIACMPYWPIGLDENGNWC